MVLQKNFRYSRNDRLMGLELFAPRTTAPTLTFCVPDQFGMFKGSSREDFVKIGESPVRFIRIIPA